MRRGIASTIAFYIGIVCIILAIIVKGFATSLPVAGISLIHFANSWFLIALVSYVHDIWMKTGRDIKKPE